MRSYALLAGNAHFRYAYATQTWEALAAPPVLSVMPFKEAIMLEDNSGYLHLCVDPFFGNVALIRYSIADDAWTTLGVPPAITLGSFVRISGDLVLLVGGQRMTVGSERNENSNTIYSYSVGEDKWRAMTSTIPPGAWRRARGQQRQGRVLSAPLLLCGRLFWQRGVLGRGTPGARLPGRWDGRYRRVRELHSPRNVHVSNRDGRARAHTNADIHTLSLVVRLGTPFVTISRPSQ